MSRQVSRGSAPEYQADERAGAKHRRQVDGDRVGEPDAREGPETEKAEGTGARERRREAQSSLSITSTVPATPHQGGPHLLLG